MIQVVAALIWDHDRFLACQRPAHKTRGLMWEFVGGKVEPGESREDALVRECMEELGVEIRVNNVYYEVDHIYPDMTIHLILFNATISNGTPQLYEHNALYWMHPSEIPNYTFCPADTEILIKIQDDAANLGALRQALYDAADPQYKDFYCSLMPTVDPSRVLGVRMPKLRQIAKHYLKDCDWFLARMPLEYYEEQNLYGILISQCFDFDKTLALLNQFLPHIDNWATCDLIVPKSFLNCPELACKQALTWIKSDHPYTVRFGIGVLMRFGNDPDFNGTFADKICCIKADDYYVKMMIAWYFATMLSTHFSESVLYLEQRKLPKWIHNKTIQKGIDSHLLIDAQKDRLRSLRI